MSLAPISPAQLKQIVSEHPDWEQFLRPTTLAILYMDLTGQTFSVDIKEKALQMVELRNLVDLTHIHLLREAEAAKRTEQRGSTAGRPRRTLKAVKWKLSIREDLALFLDLHLLDPVRGQVQLGARSVLVEELLLKWARERGFKN